MTDDTAEYCPHEGELEVSLYSPLLTDILLYKCLECRRVWVRFADGRVQVLCRQ